MQQENKSELNCLNPILTSMDVYASKAISMRAKADPDIANLSFGEPAFGPPEYLLDAIREDMTVATFMDAAKRYEGARGSLSLRQAIANWYRNRYGLNFDPEQEIMVTHGGVEAITLALLVTTGTHDQVAITNPSYMLYARTIRTLGRQCKSITRPLGTHEYVEMLRDESQVGDVKAMIVNSPENPTGYVASKEDWDRIGAFAARRGLWVIHDEVYDIMNFERLHIPARMVSPLAANSILVNSFSKKFGLPGLRIGWMVASPRIIEMAAKAHDYLYLGVNIQFERIAERLLNDPRKDSWLANVTDCLSRRCATALTALNAAAGYAWPRHPLGAMFLFPNVERLYNAIPMRYRSAGLPVGDAVAAYLFEERKVAVVPGSVYGTEGDNHIRLVLCSPEEVFEQAVARCGRPVDSTTAPLAKTPGAHELFMDRGYIHIQDSAVKIDFLRLENECASLVRRAEERLATLEDSRATTENELIVVPEAANPQQLCRIEYLAGSSIYIRSRLVDQLAALIERVIGQPVTLFKDKCNFKNPGGGAFPPHQDITAYRHFDTEYQVTAAVMLDRAVRANGALEMASYWKVAPEGTPFKATPRGNLPLLPSYVGGLRNGDIMDDLSCQMTWEIIEADPGDIVLFDSYVPHRSGLNQSACSRRVLFFTFNLASEGDLYSRYYRTKRAMPNDPIFHVSTPTMHSARD